jgi:hypothetical protein
MRAGAGIAFLDERAEGVNSSARCGAVYNGWCGWDKTPKLAGRVSSDVFGKQP